MNFYLKQHMNCETTEHCFRTAFLAINIAKQLHCSESEIHQIGLAATYHDIGKIYIPEKILNKPAKLTDEEYEIIKRHPQLGCDLIKDAFSLSIQNAIRYHHENEDGTGYYHLQSQQIPWMAKLIHICDVYDALNNDRIYRKAWSQSQIKEYFLKHRGQLFDCNICDALFHELNWT